MATSNPRRLVRIGGVLVFVLGVATGLVVQAVTDEAEAKKGGSTLWAVVQANGTIQPGESKGVVENDRTGVGSYLLTFNRNVSGCALVATRRGGAGFVSAAASGTSEQVQVETLTTTVQHIDASFSLVVHC